MGSYSDPVVVVKTRVVPRNQERIMRELIKEIAMDIGKETAAYIEVMYPEAVKAASSTFLLSLRNHVYNEIMASLELTQEGAIRERIDQRKKFRRELKAQYRKIRKNKIPAA